MSCVGSHMDIRVPDTGFILAGAEHGAEAVVGVNEQYTGVLV